jgi:hypothetical protein
MKFALIGAVLITLPAIAGFFYGLVTGNKYITLAALASLSLNSLPFIAAGLLMRRSNSDDLGH